MKIQNGRLINEANNNTNDAFEPIPRVEAGFDLFGSEDTKKETKKSRAEKVVDIKIQNGKEIRIRRVDPSAIQSKINKEEFANEEMKSASDPLVEFYRGNNNKGQATGAAGFSSLLTYLDDMSKTEKERNDLYNTYRDMDRVEFMHKALEIISDDATQINEFGNKLKIFSTDNTIVSTLKELLFDTLDLNNELWTIVYETCKYGDNYYEIVLDDYQKPTKVIGINYLKPDNMTRVEIKGKLQNFVYKQAASKEVKKELNKKGLDAEEEGIVLQPWQVIHFKIPSKDSVPYGRSVMYSGIKTYKRLNLLEDSLLIYRIERAPERRVFYIDTGNLNAQDSQSFVEKVKNSFNKTQIIDDKGQINANAAAMSVLSNYYIPVRAGSSGTRIEPLAGGTQLNEIKDIDYFKDKFLKTVNIPAAYLDDSQGMQQKGSLSSVDMHFARFEERIQGHITHGLNKLCAVQLFLKGYDKKALTNFQLELTPPSAMKETMDIELSSSRFNLVQTILAMEKFPFRWVAKKYLKLSDKEIFEIELEKNIEAQGLNAAAGMTPGGEAGGFGGMPPPEGMPPAEIGALPPDAGMPPAEGMPPEGAPPATTEAPAPVEAPAAPGLEVAGTIINLLGKEFLIENKNDFFKLTRDIDGIYKMLDEDKKPSIKKEINNTNIKKQILLGEISGLSYVRNKKTKKSSKKIIVEEKSNVKKYVII
jgi:hypothetical protein